MANYLVASGSRKLSQLEIATNPVPAGSSSIMPLVIGDAIPITNGTTVQITPDNFLSNLVFDANETYTGGNTFSGTNTFSAINTFTANNIFSGINNFSGSSTVFNIASSSVNYQTAIQGGEIELFDGTVGDTLRIKIYSGDGVKFEDFGGSTYGTFMEVGTQKGEITLKRNTTIEGNLTVNEVFYVYETSSILTSSGSTQFGDSIDDTHLFTGSIKITGSLNIVEGGLIDGVDVSVFKSDYDTASGSFSTRVSTNETNISQNTGDITLLSSSYENFSGSQYNNDSASFSSDITENSQSLSLLSGSYETASGSFSTRVTNNELTGSDHEDRIVKGTNAVTSSAVSSSYIDLDVLANGDIPAHKAGRLFFGSEDGALEVYNEVTDFTLQVGQEFVIRAFNKSGVVIENGTPVYASGSQGDRIGIYPATANSHSGTGFYDYDNHILGVATHEIGISSEGYVTSQGIVRGVDTQNFTAGDLLFLQTGSPATPEDHFRNTPPPFPYDIVQVGYVAREAANGFVFVEPKEPVHFGIISGLSGSTNQVPGDLWVYQENGSFTTTHNLTGSYTLDGNLVGGQFTGSFSGSFEGDGTNITNVTATGVDFDNISNKPTLISQSQQVDADNVTNFDSNVLTYINSLGAFSGSSQVDADSVTNFDSNVLTYINSLGAFSGSSQVDADSVTNFDSNVLTYINSLNVNSGSVTDNSIFRQTGSYQSTANDLQITGSVAVSNDITASKLLLDEGTDNIFVGLRVGAQLDSVSSANNVALGTDALGGQSAVGSQNVDASVAIGYNALYRVSTGGSSNVGVGYRALFDNTSGNHNTSIGTFAGSNIDIGETNTTIGSNSGLAITSGNGNTTVGYLANVQNATDFNSIVIGSGSVGNGSNTVVIGNDNIISTELKGNVTASGIISSSSDLEVYRIDAETTISASKLFVKDSIGTDNVAIGEDSNKNIATGANYNVSLGSFAGVHNTTGERNVAIGWQSIGFGGVSSNLTGDDNTAIGYRTLGSVQTTANKNVAIGSIAGFDITTGYQNTIIGYGADVGTATDNNSTVIGYNAVGGGSNSVTIGNTSNQDVFFRGDLIQLKSTTASSNVRIKLHCDTDTDPKTSIEFQRGANDTWGADAYRDFRLENDGGEFTLEYGESGTTRPAFKYDTSNRILFQTGSYDITTKGVVIDENGRIMAITTDNVEPLLLNRQDSDGLLIEFRQANVAEGSIEVSGATVTLNGFAGAHESSGISTGSLIGTVVSTIDELDTREVDGVTQTIQNHAKIKVSDVVGDSRVYGVVGKYNEKNGKPQIVAVGIGSVLVTGPCSGGDLLESNGDGTARVQSDDIIRSKTIGKVTIGDSNEGVKLVSCVLYCG